MIATVLTAISNAVPGAQSTPNNESDLPLTDVEEQTTISDAVSRVRFNERLPGNWHSQFEIRQGNQGNLNQILLVKHTDHPKEFALKPTDTFAPSEEITIGIQPDCTRAETDIHTTQSLADALRLVTQRAEATATDSEPTPAVQSPTISGEPTRPQQKQLV